MKKKITVGSAIVLVLLVSLLVFQLTYNFVARKFQTRIDTLVASDTDFSRLLQADALIREHFVGSIDSDALNSALINGYVSALGDKYTRYLDASQYAEYISSKSGTGQGIGIRVTFDSRKNQVVIYSVFADSPAEKAGIQKGDILAKVDGTSVSELGYSNAIGAVSGTIGTSVTVTVEREVAAKMRQFEFTVERREIAIESISFELLQNEIGYIQIFTFDDKTAAQFQNALAELKTLGAKAYVFDVRNNTGGKLEAVLSMLDSLLPEGTIIRTYDKNGREETVLSDANCFDAPMAVLVNSVSASASELFAAALQDYEAAVVVGETTYGKGTAQVVLELDDGSALILSNKKFSPPISESFEGVGVIPNLTVSLDGKNMYLISRSEDTQLQTALEAVLTDSEKEIK